MALEIYKEPELEEMIDNKEIVSEWKEQIEALGMKGQQKLISPESNNSPSVYMFMNESMNNIFKTLCPKQVEYKSYEKSTIPLQVLKEIAFCVHESYFHKIEIWYDDIDPDPICIGYTNKEYNSPKHLIARWGDEIMPFAELRIKASNRLLNHINKQYELMENSLEHSVNKYLNGEYASLSISFHDSRGYELPF